jgi:hypothetical protein
MQAYCSFFSDIVSPDFCRFMHVVIIAGLLIAGFMTWSIGQCPIFENIWLVMEAVSLRF